MANSVAFLCSGFSYKELKRYSICILIVSRFLEVVKDTTEIFSKKFAHLHLILNRLDYLKQHRRGTYGNLKAQAKLNQHLHEIDVQASELLESVMSDLAKKNNINEELKARDQLRWFQEMNAIKACAEEIILREVVYQ